MTLLKRTTSPTVLAVAFALAACDPSSEPPPSANDSTRSAPASIEPTGPDPLVPYSPSPSQFVEKTTGYLGETLTLPTAEGTKLYVTLESTSMTTEFVDDRRSLAVWLEVENPGGADWTGDLGVGAEIIDENGLSFRAVSRPTAADLHPDPQRYGYSNRNLARPVTVTAGDVVQGAIVFRPTGGNRDITVQLSLDGGTSLVAWQTAMGPF
jgi:hypothetical protein